MRSTIFFLVGLNLGAVLSEIVRLPSNTAVIAGEGMNMNCLTVNNSKVNKWTVFSVSRSVSTIYRNGEFTKNMKHFGVEINANGPVIIYANSTKSSDAGIYTCQCEINGKDVEYSAHLILLESLPVCESNLTVDTLVDGDNIWIRCSVNFRGFWAPRMEWIQHGHAFGSQGINLTNGTVTMHRTSQGVTSTFTISVNSSTDGSYYLCKIYFVKDDNTEVTTTADNVPNFTYIWNSSVIYASTKSAITVSSPTAEEPLPVYWYVVSVSLVAVLTIVFILIVTLVIARSIRRKKALSTSNARPAAISDMANRQQNNPSVSLYAEARFDGPTVESRHGTKCTGSSLPESHDTQNSRARNYRGADGTEYMEVNVMVRQPMPARLPTQANGFNVVGEYASIDHTLSPPIPPRGRFA